MHDKPSRTTFRARLDEMVQLLRNEIVTGRLQSGEFLPSIQQLSKQHQLSVNSVQKGLDQLEEDALIERIPRVGIRVADPGGSQTASVSFAYYPSLMRDIDLESLIACFEEEHPHIRIRPVPLQLEHYQEAARYYLDEGIDILAVNYFHFNEFMERHADLGQILEQLEPAEEIYPDLAEPFEQNGKLYAQPLTFSPVILCYNQEHFTRQGVEDPSSDWTWQDFMACLARLEEGRRPGTAFYFHPAAYNRWPIFLLQSGLSFGEKRTGSRPEALHDSIRTCYDLIRRQQPFPVLLSEQELRVEELFAQQKVSVMMTTYFNLNALQDLSFPYGIAPLPYVKVPKTLLLTIGLALNHRSREKEAAQTFLRYMASFPAQLHIRKHTLSIPAHRQAAEWDGEVQGYRPPQFSLFRDIRQTYSLLSDLNLKPSEIQNLLNIMNLYWTGLEDQETTLRQLSEMLQLSDR
ncbi:extracellular solute-binding protein [Paenibacillus dakarensis]|uniref:extracellular solute-binding protein n=1 Tax=Paenibacillus dakarensis TaxID=1527293 RepID=UPI0006D56540|nr:extracellular solute-binding protein [Paenibacillus dakarensis]